VFNRSGYLSLSGAVNNQSGDFAMDIIFWLIIGGVAGWIAGQLMRGGGFGLIGNIIVGIIGALVGGFVFGLLGLSADGSTIGSLVTATVGAVILLFIVSLIKRA
jgi:uncharacterized membrane protein YeaQ/YmgE (transglycosylase-associated protein family)